MATDPFSNFKVTPFISQYAGLPIEEFAQSAQALQQRGMQNREQLDKLDMMAYQIQTAPIDESVKQARIKSIRDEQERIAQSGAYEMATDLVRGQVRDFTRDKRLQTAQSNYASYLKMLKDSENLSPAQQQKVRAAYAKYVSEGGVGEQENEFGRYNTMTPVQFYEDQSISGFVSDFTDNWMANQNAYASPDGKGYIISGTNKFVPYEEVYNMAMQAIQADPKMVRQLNDEALYKLSQIAGDPGVMFTGNPMDKLQVVDPATGETKEVSARDYVAQQYVNPYAVKESFEQLTKDVKADPLLTGSGSADAAKLGDVSFMVSEAVNFGTVPDYDSYTSELESAQNSIATIQEQLNQTITEDTRRALLNNLSKAQNNLSRLQSYKQEYITSLPKEDQFAVKFADALAKEGINSIPTGSVDQSRDGRVTNRGMSEKDFTKFNKANEIYRELYMQEYGQAPDQVSFSPMYMALNKGKNVNNKSFSSEDFKGFINNLHETSTVAPGIYQFSDKLRSSGGVNTLRDAIQGGNIAVYHSGDQIGANEEVSPLLKKVKDLEIIGVTKDAGKGPMIAVKVPVYDSSELKKVEDDDVRDFIADNPNKVFYIQELGSNNLATKVNSLMLEAAKAHQTSVSLGNAAGANYAQEFIDDSRGVANPNYFSTELARAANDRTESDLYVPGANTPAAKIKPVVVGGTTYFTLDIYDLNTGKVVRTEDTKRTKAEMDDRLQRLYEYYN